MSKDAGAVIFSFVWIQNKENISRRVDYHGDLSLSSPHLPDHFSLSSNIRVSPSLLQTL